MESLFLSLFKAAQFAFIVVFTYFISDLRKKNQSSALIDKRLLTTLKLSYVFLVAIYSYVVLTLTSVSWLDGLALAITSSGTLMAATAKLTLSSKHTWAGYCFTSADCFVAKGIYAYIRHPLYAGIYVFVVGGALTLVPNLPWFVTVVVGLPMLYAMGFLAVVANRETKYLAGKLGAPYKEYVLQVHPFLPFKKFNQP